MRDLIFRGNIFLRGRMVTGTYNITKNRLIEGSNSPAIEGTLLPAPINFHTHIGDSFISEEPKGSIPEIVGPGGFKITRLESVEDKIAREAMKKTINYMKSQGVRAFMDFRESGIRGLEMVPKFNGIKGIFLTRPKDRSEILYLIENSDGFGMSSISDYDHRWLLELSRIAKARRKLFAIHFSENRREDIDRLLALKPDYIVHAIEASEGDLEMIAKNGIPVAITPRSNLFFGKNPDYSSFLKAGISLMLGTDNVFISEPNIWQEAEFLYRHQRNAGYINPDEILSIMIDNPRAFALKKGIDLGKEKYVLFENEFLTSYQIITRHGYYRKKIISPG